MKNDEVDMLSNKPELIILVPVKVNAKKLNEFVDALSIAGKRGCEAGKALRRLALASDKCSKSIQMRGKINDE